MNARVHAVRVPMFPRFRLVELVTFVGKTRTGTVSLSFKGALTHHIVWTEGRAHITELIVSTCEVKLEMLGRLCNACSISGIMIGTMSIVRLAKLIDSLKLPVFVKMGVVRLSERNVARLCVTFNTAVVSFTLVAVQPIVPLISMLGRSIGQQTVFAWEPVSALVLQEIVIHGGGENETVIETL